MDNILTDTINVLPCLENYKYRRTDINNAFQNYIEYLWENELYQLELHNHGSYYSMFLYYEIPVQTHSLGQEQFYIIKTVYKQDWDTIKKELLDILPRLQSPKHIENNSIDAELRIDRDKKPVPLTIYVSHNIPSSLTIFNISPSQVLENAIDSNVLGFLEDL